MLLLFCCNALEFIALETTEFSPLRLQPDCAATSRPVIGILSQPGDFGEFVNGPNVKFLELAGARVVPISYLASAHDIKHLMSLINGVVFPGGNELLKNGQQYFETGKVVWDEILKANKRGDYFPLFGICQGFEQILLYASGDDELLSNFSGTEDVALPFTLTGERSAFLSSIPSQLITDATLMNLTYNAHDLGISPSAFDRSPASSLLKAVATGTDDSGKPFLAIVEGKDLLPVYGVQFHPEKVIFEMDEFESYEGVPHSLQAIRFSQAIANAFVEQTRCNSHTFADVHTLSSHLIQNHHFKYAPFSKDLPESYKMIL